MSDRIVALAVSPYVTWQGPEGAIPAHLRAVGGQVEAFGGTGGREEDRALSGDLVSREAVIALIEAERVRVLSRQDGKHPGVDQNLRLMALLLPGLVDALRALPAAQLAAEEREASLADERRRNDELSLKLAELGRDIAAHGVAIEAWANATKTTAAPDETWVLDIQVNDEGGAA